MKKKSYFTSGSGARKAFVSSFQDKTELKEVIDFNNKSNILDKIFHKSSENMHELENNSISLTVTSPPYNIGKDSDLDLTDDEYWAMMKNIFTETYRVTESGGRLVVNVANLGRKPYIPFSKYFTELLIEIGFIMRGEIIWQKSKGANANFAWGSWLSASNPVIRDIHEYCLVFSKDSLKKSSKGESSIEKEEFMESTLSIWNINPARAKKIGHPAPFPIELPQKFINLYTYKNDLILDPFLGSGTTALAAKLLKRNYVGYEIEEKYIAIAKSRLKTEVN
jgi:site-specific DNA-methyltransferase (adenine-specific)